MKSQIPSGIKFLFWGILFLVSLVSALNPQESQAQNSNPAILDYSAAAPYLNEQTVALNCWNIKELDLIELQKKSEDLYSFFLPEMMKLTKEMKDYQTGIQAQEELQKRLNAASKISGGIVFSVWSQEGVLGVVPLQNRDEAAEAQVESILKDYPFGKFESEETQTLTNALRKNILVRKTDKAILFFTSYAALLDIGGQLDQNLKTKLGNPEMNFNPQSLEALLDAHLKASERADFKAAIEQEKEVKAHTLFAVMPPALREKAAFGIEEIYAKKQELKGIEEEELQKTLHSFQTVTLIQENLTDLGKLRFTFQSEKDAENVIRLRKLANESLLKGILEDPETPSGVADIYQAFYDFMEVTQNGKSVELNLQNQYDSFCQKYFGFWNRMREFQKEQREKAQIDAEKEGKRQFELLAPWITEGTLLAVRVDLNQPTPQKWLETVHEELRALAPNWSQSESFQENFQSAAASAALLEKTRETLLKAGAKEVFVLADPTNLNSPIRFIVPGLSIANQKNSEKDTSSAADSPLDASQPNGTFLTLDEVLKDDLQPLAELKDLLNGKAAFGTWKGALVILPTKMDAEAVWMNFCQNTQSLEPERLANISLAVKENCGSAFWSIFRMTPLAPIVLDQALNNLKQDEEYPFYVPPTKILVNGLDTISLAFDPNKGWISLNIWGKSDKSARNMMKLFGIWKKNLYESWTKAAVSEIENGENPETANQTEVIQAAFQDYVNWIAEFTFPKQEGNRLYWDYSNNEKIQRFFKEVKPYLGPIAAGASAGLLLPAVSQARTAARQMQSSNNFKFCALAMLNYEAATETFPPAYSVDENGKPLHSWRVHLLPFLEEGELYKKIRLDEPWDSEWNRQFHDQCPNFYRSVFKPEDSQAVIGVVVGEGCVFEPVTEPTGIQSPKGTRLSEIKDGSSNTILLVPCEPVCWMDPAGNVPFEQAAEGLGIFVEEGGIFTVSMADGSVVQLPASIDLKTLVPFFLKDDGEFPEAEEGSEE